MADKERAKKLAAAKKKLKAYRSGEKKAQIKDVEQTEESNDEPKLQNYFNNKEYASNIFEIEQIQNLKDVSNISEKKIVDSPNKFISKDNVVSISVDEASPSVTCSRNFNAEKKNENSSDLNMLSHNSSELLKTIEVLISEKAHLTRECSKYEISSKDKELELEEVKTRLNGANKRIEEIEKLFFAEQKKNVVSSEQIKSLEFELKIKKTQSEEFSEHIEELKRELSLEKARINELEKDYRDKINQLELKNINNNQISDENNIKIDNRIEELTETKFMNEKQIADLQTLIQQLQTERDNINQKYQNYVQHLNKEIATSSEKVSDLKEENSKLSKREQELVDHISTLEKEIQQNIVRTESLRQNMQAPSVDNNGDNLKIEVEQLKKSEEKLKTALEEKSKDLIEKEKVIEEKIQEILSLQSEISNLLSARPNDAKLLASIESDKVAASRAMTQNSELRKQLDELQIKLIELTNDKMDLTNNLDSERFTNKQIRQNYEEMQNQIITLSDQLHFKDEEMIRLSHENNELVDKLTELQKLNDELVNKQNLIHTNSVQLSRIEGSDQNSENCVIKMTDNVCVDDTNKNISENAYENICKRKDSDAVSIPTSEAMERLEERFKKLMKEVVDLTDEKQQLEHLVLQLQGETETIGEYIALYQSQRKILKQKEYERDAQLKRLLAEREDLREKALQLEILIKEIGFNSISTLDATNNKNKLEINNENLTENKRNIINGHQETDTIPAQNFLNNLDKDNEAENTIIKENKFHLQDGSKISESDSQKIIDRIHSLVSDLKNNQDSMPVISNTADHCACCSGEFETI